MKIRTRLLPIILVGLFGISAFSQQPCKTNDELAGVAGKYTNAANNEYAGEIASYFSEIKSAADKATAKQVLTQIENIELKSRANFPLVGGVLKNAFSSKRTEYYGKNSANGYSFQSGFYEYFCLNNKLKVNGEFSTVLRIYVNNPLPGSLAEVFNYPFPWKFDTYDSMRFANWKQITPSPLISIFKFLTISDPNLLQVIKDGNGFYQDVPDKDIKVGSRQMVTRFWFLTKKNVPLVLEVSRKEYLQALLEYYERENEYFAQPDAKPSANWKEQYVTKKGIIQKALTQNSADWLAKQAVIDRTDESLKAQYGNYAFVGFADGKRFGQKLYQFNPEYFSPNPKDATKPQLIIVAFRFVPQPLHFRLLDNFVKNFDFEAVQKLIQ